VLLVVASGEPRPAAAQNTSCGAGPASIRFDHVTIAVGDLETASSTFRDRLGFSLKPGRVHANGLRNAHVRFADHSALELMSAGAGQPDALSEWYRRFLAGGDGGAFVALRAGPVDSVLQRLGSLAEEAIVFRGKAFDWASFPDGHPLRAIFFVDVRSRPEDQPDQLRHENGATGLSEVWVETPDTVLLSSLLSRFGSRECGRHVRPGGWSGLGYGLEGGTLVAVPVGSPSREYRVVGVVLKSDRVRPGDSANGVWLDWEGAHP
jgi:catechol 2,3-dioxygenase-like lactoylglutathione lyase family enzyme